MPDLQATQRIAAALARHGGVDATAGHIAEAVFIKCQAIEAALTPVIGARGVAALNRRSLLSAARIHPWLSGELSVEQAAQDQSTLTMQLSRQSSADAALAGATFLQAFYELLSSLVGPSLTERLLRRVWIDFLGAAPAQDTQS